MIHLLFAAALIAGAPTSEGASLYDVHCSSCHGTHLQGSVNAPPLIGKSAGYVDFMLQTGRMPAAVTEIQAEEKRPQFSQQQITAIVSYVASQSHGDPQLPLVSPGNIQRGRELFAENCEQCHGVSAHGASAGYANVAPSLMNALPEQIAEAVRNGPGQMPRFGTDVIGPRDVDDVVSYIGFLQHDVRAYNPGGLQLANVGPVAEGFVAWVFGLGLLVLFVRRVGTTE